MLKYLLQRLFIAVPTMVLVSILVFLLGRQISGDPIFTQGGQPFSGATHDPDAEAAFMVQQAHTLKVDKPAFYFSIGLNCLSDTLYKVQPTWRRDKMKTLAIRCGNWDAVVRYEQNLAAMVRALEKIPDSLLATTQWVIPVSVLKTATDIAVCDTLIRRLKQQTNDPEFQSAAAQLQQSRLAIQLTSGWGMPVLNWYGTHNLYHAWLTSDYAAEEHSPWKKLHYPLRVTLLIKISAILLAVGIAIPLGMLLGSRPKWDKYGKRLLVLLYVIPALLIGCGLRYLFATPGHGLYSAWIGGIGTSVYNSSTASFWSWALSNTSKLMLPVLTSTAHILALLALQMRSGVITVLQQDYIRTARAKGLPERQILWRHTLRNASFPIVVILGNLLPSVVGGAVIVELIFSINGLGYTTYDAILHQDYPILMSIVILATILTISGNLIADLILAWLDPRVRSGMRR